MKIDYEKLGRIIEKIEDESPCRSMQWKELTEAARQVIAESGLLEEVERLQAKVRMVEEVYNNFDPNHECTPGKCCALDMVEELTAAMKGEI